MVLLWRLPKLVGSLSADLSPMTLAAWPPLAAGPDVRQRAHRRDGHRGGWPSQRGRERPSAHVRIEEGPIHLLRRSTQYTV